MEHIDKLLYIIGFLITGVGIWTGVKWMLHKLDPSKKEKPPILSERVVWPLVGVGILITSVSYFF